MVRIIATMAIARRNEELHAVAFLTSQTNRAWFDMDEVWQRILDHAGERFHTHSGLPFTYEAIAAVRGPIRIFRDGHEINRNISRASFEKAFPSMPCDRPSDIPEVGVVGRSYVWAILNDPRIS